MSGRDNGRVIEGTLSLGMLVLVLVPVWGLVYLAKMRSDPPPDAIMVNEATAQQFRHVLGVDPEIARRLTDWRERHHGFESVDALLDVPLLGEEEAVRAAAVAHAGHLDLRSATPRLFASAFGLTPQIAHRLAAYRDSLLPSPFEPATAPAPATGTVATGRAPVAPAAGAAAVHGERFEPVVLLRRAPLLDARAARPAMSRFLIRTPATVMRRFWIGAALFAVVALFLPAWMRSGKRGGDPFLLPLSLLLSGLGVAILFSIKDPLRDRAVYEHHLFGLLFSLIVMAFCARLAPLARGRIRKYLYLWTIGAFILVAALFVFGSGPEGVKLNLFHFQPVEIIKLFLIFFLASYLSDRADLIADTSVRNLKPSHPITPSPTTHFAGTRPFTLNLPRRQDLGPVVVMFAVALALFLVIKDMGPGLLMFATFVALLCVTTGRGSFLIPGVCLLLAGGLLGYAAHFGVFTTRVDMWLHPFANSHPNGMQLGQGYWGLASGGWEGSGPGLGIPGAIPRGGSDLAFASWGEETGLAGTWLALLVYAVLVWRGIAIALRARNDFDRALAFGLTILLGMQTLLILAGVTGAMPLSGISLPFMSYGNSALVASFVVTGLLRGISARTGAGDEAPIARPTVIAAAKRFSFAYAAVLLIGIGAIRLTTLQVLKADEIAVAPIRTPDADRISRPHTNPRLLAVERQIERGSIFDASGRPLATSRYAEMVGGDKRPEANLTPDGQTADPGPNAPAHGVPHRPRTAAIRPKGPLACPPAQARRLAAAHGRWYPYGPALAHIAGYLDPSVGGPFGLEKSVNTELRGYLREVDLLADYRRRNLPGYVPRHGHDVYLTIDADLQREVQETLNAVTASLKDTVTGRRKDRAAFVLMRPETGDIVAAATLPAFDPNGLTPAKLRALVQGEEAMLERPLINRAVSGWYPPGSTFKIATSAAAMELLPNAESIGFTANRVSGDIRWRANGQSYARSKIHDDRGDPDFGTLTLPRAFEVSSNIYFSNLAAKLDPNDFRAFLVDNLGFSHVPRQTFFDADLPDIGYGQGRMLASPLEMCRLCGTVANGGASMQPRLVTKVDTFFEDPRPPKDKLRRPRIIQYPPTTLKKGVSPETAQKIRVFMRRVVTNGTARAVFDDLPFAVAGKTGTAQNHQYDRQPHSWFAGFAPFDESATPRYAFACVVENGGYGKTVAAVICRDVLRKLNK